jgi:hypothetical protein
MSEEPKCPECEKLYAVHEKSQMIGSFLDWLFSNGRVLCEWYDFQYFDEDGDLAEEYVKDRYTEPEGYYPTHDTIESLLAEYFEINMNKVNKEREELINWIRTKE